MKYYLLFISLSLIGFSLEGQSLSNIIEKEIKLTGDTIVLDSLSIVPETFSIKINDKELNDSIYMIDYEKAMLIFKKGSLLHDIETFSVKVKYRVFPVNLTKKYFRKEQTGFDTNINRKNIIKYQPQNNSQNFFNTNQLHKSGSISRGITVGNNQDASVNSDFNLQLSGKIMDNISIQANITDNNIPIQADGTSQHLREFDKVFIKLYTEKSELIFGDFEIKKPVGYFMNYKKKVQGAGFRTNLKISDDALISTSVHTAVSKGKFRRQHISSIEGNQGPYRLSGINNELFVIVLSGSEKVYIDGLLQSRGANNDYIIDYNSAEILFTPKRPITKDSRIIVEFEYSELSYTQFAISSENMIQTKNSKFFLNIFSEHDAKNQNIRQDLSYDNKLMFRSLGDNIGEAYVENAQEIDTFYREDILYYKTDTLVNSIQYNNVFVFSADSLMNNYRVGFTYVGANNGNYRRVLSSANGRVFEWVAPEDGILQGDHEPVKLLISPKKHQMISFGGETVIKGRNKIMFETVVSNNDLNLFSSEDDKDNIGFAFNIGLEKNLSYKDSSEGYFNIGTRYMFTDRFFKALEPYRNPEFDRDWNLLENKILFDENYFNVHFNYFRKDFGKIDFNSDFLTRNRSYSGNRNELTVHINKKNLQFKLDVNRLTTKDSVNSTEFFRYHSNFEIKLHVFNFGVSDFGEMNVLKNKLSEDLDPSSFRFNQWEVYIKTNEKNKSSIGLSYMNREDFIPLDQNLGYSSASHDLKLFGTVYNSRKNKLKTFITYRNLKEFNSSGDITSGKTLTGRIEHFNTVFKGLFISSGQIEHITGNEPVKEYTYLEVQSGQGYFTWLDFNGNNLKELNEFVRANFRDEANYIRISVPTNSYEGVFNQTFRQNFEINPYRIWKNKTGVKKLLSSLNERFSFQYNRKITSSSDYLKINITDSSMRSMNSILRNKLILNIRRSRTKLNYIFISNENKLLLINGIDTRNNAYHDIILNQKIKSFVLSNSYMIGFKTYDSEFFSENNFRIDYNVNKSSLLYEIDNRNDISGNFSFKSKVNTTGEEKMKALDIGAEYKYSNMSQANVMLKFNYININYNSISGSSISYEMLEGLLPGKNYVWSILWYKNLTDFLRLEFNYSGRKSEENRVIHTGNMSIRAFF